MSIPMNADCYLCHMRRNLEAVRTLGDEETAARMARELMKLYLQLPESSGSPELGPATEELMQRGNWSTIADYPRSTLEDVAKKLLHTPAVVYDWNALKMEAIDRLWKGWETQTAQTDLNAYLTDAVNALVTNQELPGLKSGFWLAVTTDGSRYILASVGEQWAICPVEALR